MGIIWIVSIFVFFFGAFAQSLYTFRQFDMVVKSIYEYSIENWEYLGRPMGFSWIPDGVGGLMIRESLSRSRLYNMLIRVKETDELMTFITNKEALVKFKKCHRFGLILLIAMFLDLVLGFAVAIAFE